MNIINDNIKKFNNGNNLKIRFLPEEEYIINNFLKEITNFGKITFNTFKLKIKKCPANVSEDLKYTVSGDKENIITKIGNRNKDIGIICENELEKDKEYRWKIKILRTQNKYINVGITPNDFDFYKLEPYKYGWYLYCSNLTLYSGPPHNYSGKSTNLKNLKDEIIIEMDMKKKTLKFIIDNEETSYSDIPIDKPLCPIITLCSYNDSVELIEC